VGFLCLIAACVVFARRFAAEGERGWAVYSLATGIIFFVGFAGIASGNRFPWINIGFGITVVSAWAWISAVCARTLAALQR
jgi:hypothetical protein